MMTRFMTLVLLLVSALASPAMAQRQTFPVNYTIIKAGIQSHGWAFNVATMTDTWTLSGHTGFTAHVEPIFTINGMTPLYVEWATAGVVIMSNNGQPTRAQFKALYYDTQGLPVWENLGAEIVQNMSYNPDNRGSDVTAQMRTWGPPAYRQIGIAVQGNGVLLQAKVSVVYSIDAGTGPAGATGPAGPAGSLTGPLSNEQLQQIADDMRERLTTK